MNCSMENKYNNLSELEEMRNQISLLKTKLESQEIVNDRLLRESMTGRLDSIKRTARTSIAGSIAAVALCGCIFIRYGFSPVFIATTAVMLTACAAILAYFHRRTWKKDFLDGNLLDAAKELTLLKKRYCGWGEVGCSVAVLWFVWLSIESFRHLGESAVPFVAGALAGGVVGGIIGIRANRRTAKKADEILEDIESLRRNG